MFYFIQEKNRTLLNLKHYSLIWINFSFLSISVSTSNKDEMPEEVPYESNKNKKKNRKSSDTNVEEPSQGNLVKIYT